MKNVKLLISYGFLILTLIIYIASNSYIYKLELEKNNLDDNIDQLQTNNEQLTIEINSKNSKESILNDYPNLEFRNNNIYFLEEESNE